jgi:ankyrin repeat protein
MYVAIQSGSLSEIQRLVNEDAELEARDTTGPSGWTPLQRAADRADYNSVDHLIRAGSEINAGAAAYKGRTALQAAAGCGNLAIVERLLGAGSDANAPASGYSGRTALQAASGSGHLDIVEQLLVAGAEVNTPDTLSGQTALQVAKRSKNEAIFERLLQAWGPRSRNASFPPVSKTVSPSTVVPRILQADPDGLYHYTDMRFR